MKCFEHINELATLSSSHKKDGRNLIPQDLSVIKDASIIFDDHIIHWVGETSKRPTGIKFDIIHNLKGHCVTPELVDCHTHLVFGGNRAQEYLMKIDGVDYQEIANSGGGILASQTGTNSLSEEELFLESCRKIERLYEHGVGTIEIKSGYGLTYDSEKRISLVINRLKKKFAPKIKIVNTYLAAHAVPREFSNSAEYMDKIVIPLLEELAPLKIIDAIDIFHEDGYFNEADVLKIFNCADRLGIQKKIHADEFNDNNGASLACDNDCLSCDHLLKSSNQSIAKLATSKTVATFLPGTAFFLGKEQVDARKFLDNGVKVAIASDYNPGSSHCDNLLLLASIAAPTYKMNSCELWSSITLNSAHALGLNNQGAIIKGLSSRFSIFKSNTISEITYSWGKNLAITSYWPF
jgi:imidazolonepropionase